MWSIQNILLLVSGFINLAMSIFIISRGWKNKVNLYFSLLTFFNFLWATCLIIINLGISYEISRFFASFVYVIALLIVVSLFYFIIHFPYKVFNVSKFYNRLIIFIIGIVSIFCIFAYKFFVPEVSLVPRVVVYYEFWSYSIYSILLIILMVIGIMTLLLKFKKADGVFKFQLKLILIAVIIGMVGGSYFNLFLMYFHNLDYNHLGPLFTLFINFTAFYLVFLKKKN